MIPEEADPRFCHQEPEPRLPSPSHPPAAQGGSLCLRRATGADPRSPRGTECLRRGPTWAPSPRAWPLRSRTRPDPSSPVCTTAGAPGSPAPGRRPPLSLETEAPRLEEAPSVRPPRPSRTGPPCPPPRAGPWRTSPRRRRRPWATGPPRTGRRCPRRPLRTASPRCPPPRGRPPCRRRLLRRRPAGLALPTRLRVPAAATKSPGCRSGICPSARPHRPCRHRAVRGRCRPRPARDPLPP